MTKVIKSVLLGAGVLFLSSCYDYTQRADGPGANFVRTKEYAPAMYHSEPYEPLTQIIDTSAGQWLGETNEGWGEFYNSAPHFSETGTNMLTPVEGTVKRGSTPYHYAKEDLAKAAAELVNPVVIEYVEKVKEDGTVEKVLSDEGKAMLKDCKVTYTRYCSHCHGKKGEADGNVAEIFGGVPSYYSAAVLNVTAGHIYHVITYGKGRMGAHASQVSPADRWKIATYVKHLQSQQ